MTLTLLVALGALTGCNPTEPEPEVVDMRQEFPAPADGALVWDTPEWIIGAYEEKQFCLVLTYDGPDVGITGQSNYQSEGGHHVVIFGTTTTERDLADGTDWDCTTTEQLSMTDLDPIIIGGESEDMADGGVTNRFALPEGMAAPLKSGQRIVVQSHYINATPNPILIQDQAQLEVIPEADVVTWAAPLVNTVTDDLLIPANDPAFNLTFDCAFEDPYTVLFIGGHMHEWGTAFQTRFTNATTEDTEIIYDVPEWDPYMRDAPPFANYDDGAFKVEAGDRLTTSCTWDNDEDHDLTFPGEMCVTFGMVYPTKVPVICVPEI